INRPIQADCINRDILQERADTWPDSPREADDLGARDLHAQLLDQDLHRLDAPSTEFVGRQYTRPRIENLYRIHSGLELPDEIINGSVDQNIDEERDPFRIIVRK